MTNFGSKGRSENVKHITNIYLGTRPFLETLIMCVSFGSTRLKHKSHKLNTHIIQKYFQNALLRNSNNKPVLRIKVRKYTHGRLKTLVLSILPLSIQDLSENYLLN